jgi:hypothetical protein
MVRGIGITIWSNELPGNAGNRATLRRVWLAGSRHDDGKRFCTLQIAARCANGAPDAPRCGQPKPHTIPAAAGGCPRLQGGEQSWGLKLWQGDQSWWGLEIVAPPPRVGLGLWSPPMNRSCEGLGARGHRFLRPNFPKRTEVLHTRRAIATICTRAAERPRTTACFLVLSSVVFEREQGKFDGRHKIRREPASRSLLLQSSQHACGPVRSPADPRAVAGLDMWSWAV